MITPTQKQDLKAAAEVATQGERSITVWCGESTVFVNEKILAELLSGEDYPNSDNDAKFIALANPATILALLERDRLLTEALEGFLKCRSGRDGWIVGNLKLAERIAEDLLTTITEDTKP